MKAEQVDKLYTKLTPHEQAALFFEAEISRDDAEIKVIRDSVPIQSIQRSHVDYCDRVQGLWYLAGFYGTHYWRFREQFSSHYRQALAIGCDKNCILIINRLGSMDAALIEVCKRVNVMFWRLKWLLIVNINRHTENMHKLTWLLNIPRCSYV